MKKWIIGITILLAILMSVGIKVSSDRTNETNLVAFQEIAVESRDLYKQDLENYKLIEEMKIGNTGYAFILDSELKFLYHPLDELIGEVMPLPIVSESIDEIKASDDGVVKAYIFDKREKLIYMYQLENDTMFIVIVDAKEL